MTRWFTHLQKYLPAAALLGFLLALLIGMFTSLADDTEAISDQVLRLHVIANSDSEADQAVKLEVRDAVVTEVSQLLDRHPEADNKAAVAALLGDNREQLTAAANRVLSAEGFGYTADTELCSMVFPNRVYGSKVLPAGRYDAVRVTLGQAGGQNWWCVLFPQLCIPTALADPVELEDLLTDEQAELVDNGARYELRFALWEFLVSLFE